MLHSEWSPRLDIDDKDWRDLVSRALEPNVFYEPEFLRAASEFLGPEAGHIAVWSADRSRLEGFLPAFAAHGRLTCWTSSYAPDGTVLISREDPDAVLTAAFSHLARDHRLPPLLVLPNFPRSGPLADSMDRVIAALRLRSSEFSVQARACLRHGDGDGLRRKQRKELGRQRRRLAEAGGLSTEIVSDAAAVSAALDDFLRVEASGWKGHRRTAMIQNERSHRFVSAAASGLAACGRIHILRLSAARSPAASAIVLGGGDRAWFWKITYDESFARLSPGVLLTLDLADLLGGNGGPLLIDSCAIPDHPMIDRIWRGRREFSDRLIMTRPGHTLAFAAADAGGRAVRWLRTAVMPLIEALRRSAGR